MTIVHFGCFEENKINGVSSYVYSLAKQQVHLGHRIIFCFIRESSNHYIDNNGIEFHQFGSLQLKILKFFFKKIRIDLILSLPKSIRKFIDSLPNDTIYNFHSVFIQTNHLTSSYLFKKNIKYFITPHGGYNPIIFEKNWFFKKIYFLLFERKHLKNSVLIFACCEPEGDILKLIKEIKASKVRVVNSFIKKVSLPYKNVEIIKLKIIYLGRFEYFKKGLDRILDFFSKIIEIDKEFELHFYGDGPEKSRLNDDILKLNLCNNVYLHESVFGIEKYEVLNNANAFIHLSRTEALNLSIMESVSVATPIIVTSECNYDKYIKNYGGGFIVNDFSKNCAEELILLLRDKQWIENSKIGLNEMFNENFDLNINCNKIIEHYKTISHLDE